jgi:hypothetical protein
VRSKKLLNLPALTVLLLGLVPAALAMPVGPAATPALPAAPTQARAGYGKLEGTVVGFGYCDEEWLPLEGASVQITGSSGWVWTVTAGAFGYYQIWLDESESPVTIDVSYPEYEPGHRAGVTIVAGHTTRSDFDLRWLQPCLRVSPRSLEATLDPNGTEVQQLVIANDGAATGNWHLWELDYGPATRPVRIPAAQGSAHGGDEPASIGRAPGAGRAPAGAVQDWVRQMLGWPVYAVEVYPDENLVLFDTDTPDTWRVIAGLPGSMYFGGDFLPYDYSMLYVVDYALNQLHTVDVATGAVTVLGPAVPEGGESWTGLSGALDGTLYGSATTCSSSTLYTLDPLTGHATAVGPITNGPCIIDIAVNLEGEMYGVDIVYDRLIQIDPATGAGTVVGWLGVPANYAQGLDFDGGDGVLYWAAYTMQGELRIIDTETGASTLVGAFPGGAEVDSLAFPLPCCGDIAWLRETPTSGSVLPGERVTVTVTFDAAGERPDDHHGRLIMGSNDPEVPEIQIPVSLTVRGAPYEPHFFWLPAEPMAGEVVTFDGVVGGGPEPLTFEWAFGDGTAGLGPRVAHTYRASGDYQVTLTVWNEYGQVTAQHSVHVLPGHLRTYLPLALRRGAGP